MVVYYFTQNIGTLSPSPPLLLHEKISTQDANQLKLTVNFKENS